MIGKRHDHLVRDIRRYINDIEDNPKLGSRQLPGITKLYWSNNAMSIIPTIDKKEAASIAKGYLRQFKDWQLISLRPDDNSTRTTDRAQQEHVKAMFELQERQNIIKAISKGDQASGIILDQRFIKQHSTKRTLAELTAKHHSITEGNFYHRQRKALLMAYNLIPSDQVKLVRCE